ncbi:Retrovirus-related Pol polyprotein from transposon RE1 [Vitis vinifera]|uniref:Retrovirus-related Pol polyprotein from transposon RE1 n=1 Tax=Vitis vinifera TaxID=29760 RepID=A0A438DQ74_VITVI|nr:Retrovirus-related Pol polyprotein from transposon RE1 [Vitis vinifera]
MGTKDEGSATVAMATAEPQLSFTPQMTMSNSGNRGCGISTLTSDMNCIMLILCAGTETLSPTLQLHNTLLVPSLSHKLFFVSQVTSDLNCIVLMYPTFCLLRDILTKEIIWRVTTAVHLLNRMPSKVLDFQTPLQALSGYTPVPTIFMLPPRGETRHEKQNWTELNWSSVSEIHVELRQPEHVFPTTEHHEDDHEAHVTSPSAVPENPTLENDPEVSSFNTNILAPPISYVLPNRHNHGKPPSRYSPDIEGRRSRYPIANYVSTKELNEPLKTFVHKISMCHFLTRVEEALGDPKWTQAIKDEMEALMKNKTWNLVPLPEGKKIVGCKWVFSLKHKADRSIERYKARLVAKGYTQTYGIDYQDTSSPVAKLNTIRVLISLATNLNWPLHQFDVKNAFLHGELEEEVYTDIPSGYSVTTGTNEVCKLQRALYGLKQSPRAWFGRFSLAMKKYGFQQSHVDHTLFLKKQQGKVTALIVYVDDMVITGDDIEEISRLQGQLASEFKMKNLGGLKYFLGIECKPMDTPIVQNHKLGLYLHQKPTNKGRYQRLVGKLIYLSHTRPDIAYAVSVVSQFMHCPSEEHMEAIIRILRYLKSSLGKGLMFSKNDHVRVDGYTNIDWVGNIFDRKSTSGYFTFVGGNLVTWRSKKQKVVALSSA